MAHGRADNIDHGIDRAHFMKMDGVDRSVVNLRLRRAQRLKNLDRRLLCVLADRSFANHLANVFQPTARFMSMPMSMPMSMFINRLVRVSMPVRRERSRPR